jgi:hypothetical protein
MIPCNRCSGTGLIARDGAEKDKDIHPILSQQQTICDMCGGGGSISPELKAMIEKAKAQQG